MIKEGKLLTRLEKLLSRVSKGDALVTESFSVPVSFEMDRLKSVENNHHFALGLRLFENGRVGNSYINDWKDEDLLLENARASASFGDFQDFELPRKSPNREMNFYFPEVLETSKQDMIETGKSVLERLKAIDPRAKVDVDLSCSSSISCFGNTRGLLREEKNSTYALSASMVLVHDDGSLLYVSEGDLRYDKKISTDEMIKKIEWKYRHALHKASLQSGYYPVIFAPEAVSLLLSPIQIAANGKSLYRGTSLLEGKLEERIVHPSLTLTDDPYLEDGLGSYVLDDEGVIPEPLPIIEKGVFKNFIYDLATASKLKVRSTGHAGRGISSLPQPSFSNLILSIGDKSFASMIEEVEEGLLVCETLGAGMSNLAAGDVSVNIELGYVIRKGEIVGRIKDAMIAGNVYEWFQKVGAVENRRERLGSSYYPHILIDGVSVATKGTM